MNLQFKSLAYSTPFKTVLVACDGSEELISTSRPSSVEFYASTHMNEGESGFLRDLRQLKDTIVRLEKRFRNNHNVQHGVLAL